MNFIEFLSEGTLTDIAHEKKIFIMIVGGVASGKSYFYDKHFSHIKLIDIDKYTEKAADGDWEEARKQVGPMIKKVESDIRDHFKTGVSLVNTGSGASTAGVLNKFKWAKEAGYKTAIVFVDVDVKTAQKRNRKRAKDGDRNLIPAYKVQRTNEDARKNFNTFRKAADFAVKVQS